MIFDDTEQKTDLPNSGKPAVVTRKGNTLTLWSAMRPMAMPVQALACMSARTGRGNIFVG